MTVGPTSRIREAPSRGSARWAGPARDVLLALAVVVLWISVSVWLGGGPIVAVDFVSAYLPAGEAVLHGASPYPPPGDPSLDAGSAYVYPPTLALLVLPLVLVPQPLAVAVWLAILVGALVATLLICGVRDWRCYASVALWAPTASALQTGNVSILIGLLAAIAWRFREDVRGSIGIGAAFAIKLVLFPLLAWQWSVRGWRPVFRSCLTAAVIVTVAWTAIGFAGLRSFLTLSHEMVQLEGGEAYSVGGLVESLGVSSSVARFLGVVVAGVLVLFCVRRGRSGDEAMSFVLAVLASLAAMPVLWLHGLVLLSVALAVARPTFHVVWLAPLLMWFAPVTHGSTAEVTRVLAVTAVVSCGCLLATRRPAHHRSEADRASSTERTS